MGASGWFRILNIAYKMSSGQELVTADAMKVIMGEVMTNISKLLDEKLDLRLGEM